jgi:hypothetical protein
MRTPQTLWMCSCTDRSLCLSSACQLSWRLSRHLLCCVKHGGSSSLWPAQAQSWGWRRAWAGLTRSLRQLQAPATVRLASPLCTPASPKLPDGDRALMLL